MNGSLKHICISFGNLTGGVGSLVGFPVGCKWRDEGKTKVKYVM